MQHYFVAETNEIFPEKFRNYFDRKSKNGQKIDGFVISGSATFMALIRGDERRLGYMQ